MNAKNVEILFEQKIHKIPYDTLGFCSEFQIDMESGKNSKTLRWVEDHASIIDDDYENRIPKVQFQKNVKAGDLQTVRQAIKWSVWISLVKVKPYKPSAKPSSLGKKHSIVQDIDNEFDAQFRDTRTVGRSS